MIPVALEHLFMEENKENPKNRHIQFQAQKLHCSLATGSGSGGNKHHPWGKNTKKSLSHTTHLEDHSGLLQQVGPHAGPNDVVPFVEADLNILSETAAVVIASGFSISDGLLRTHERRVRNEGFLNFMWRHLHSLPRLPFQDLSATGVTVG